MLVSLFPKKGIMSAKILDKKTNRQTSSYRKYRARDPLVQIVAADCDCSERQVRNILNGVSGNSNRRVTALQQQVAVAYALRKDAQMRQDAEIKKQLLNTQNK